MGILSANPTLFSPELIAQFLAKTGLPGILGNKHASGTEIIEEFGEEHCASGKPILYTSADSVAQIAAHETVFGLARLYEICAVMRELTRSLAIGRVIARPFIGEKRGAFQRTANRKDWAIEPSEPTILDRLTEANRKVITIGKIGDIFAHRGTGEEIKAAGNMALLDAALQAFQRLPEGGLVFANLIDFDVEFGHRRDVPGYAAALEAFDRRIPEIIARLAPAISRSSRRIMAMIQPGGERTIPASGADPRLRSGNRTGVDRPAR